MESTKDEVRWERGICRFWGSLGTVRGEVLRVGWGLGLRARLGAGGACDACFEKAVCLSSASWGRGLREGRRALRRGWLA